MLCTAFELFVCLTFPVYTCMHRPYLERKKEKKKKKERKKKGMFHVGSLGCDVVSLGVLFL